MPFNVNWEPMPFNLSWEVLAVIALFNVPAFVVVWLAFFGDWADYRRCQYYAWIPLWVDYMKDDLMENFEHTYKLSIFHTICVVIVGVEYYLIAKHDPAIVTRVSSLF